MIKIAPSSLISLLALGWAGTASADGLVVLGMSGDTDASHAAFCFLDGSASVTCSDGYDTTGAYLGSPFDITPIDADGDGVGGIIFGELYSTARANRDYTTGYGDTNKRAYHCEPDSAGDWSCDVLGLSSEGGSTGFSSAVGDFDGDGDADAVIMEGSSTESDVRFCENVDGSLSCDTVIAGAADYGHLSDGGDIDGDGNIDFTINDRYSDGSTCLGDGDGTFTCTSRSVTSTDSRYAVSGDFDGDGLMDQVIGGAGSSGLDFCSADGCTSLDLGLDSGWGPTYYGQTPADYDGDGSLDFKSVWALKNVCLGDGAGDFSCEVLDDYVSGSGADADGNGQADFVVFDLDDTARASLCELDGAASLCSITFTAPGVMHPRNFAWVQAGAVSDSDLVTVTFDSETDGERPDQNAPYTESGVDWYQSNALEGGSFFDAGGGDIGLEDSKDTDTSGVPIIFEFADGSPIVFESLEGFQRGESTSSRTWTGDIGVSCQIDGTYTTSDFWDATPNATEPETFTASSLAGMACDRIAVSIMNLPAWDLDSVVTAITVSGAVAPADSDGDGVADEDDLCEGDDASGDTDGDAVCDDTDADIDGDGVVNESDDFPADGSEWFDTDGDGVGDNADLCTGSDNIDSDADGVCDSEDACEGDDASGDADEDLYCDDADAFPDDASEWVDTDADGVGDNADAFPADANETGDEDGDGVGDNADTCTGYPNTDTDADGVCDDSDVCPTDALDADEDNDGVCDVDDLCVGSDNVDSDGDQVCDDLDLCDGNDAAGDADEDAVCSDIDNCPDDANADQDDEDGDDIGDACEADTDVDGVIDDDDSCPDDANADQSDLDEDGIGDACDDDDDGDGVVDESDNCPFYDNADQTDTDGDGYGDECDGDDDGDGIEDAADLCAGTPLDAPFDSLGCSGEQRIELTCGEPDDYGWSRRMKYVKCVKKESKSVWRAGLITKRERAHIVRRALWQVWTSYIRKIRRWC